MGHVISTVMFDGQFWILLVEKYDDDGSLRIGKHTFGPEPTYNDIRQFFMDSYHLMRFHSCETNHRVRRKHTMKESDRNTKKSFTAYADAQKEYLMEKKSADRIEERKTKDELYELKRRKRKEKKRGR